jgi:outer membrane protein insertion porin family
VPKEKLFEKVQTKQDEVFNRSKLGQDLLALKTRYEDDGFAYANITPVTAIDAERALIDITFDVQKGEKVYYERINVVGNTKTRDKVIRRELRIYEG